VTPAEHYKEAERWLNAANGIAGTEWVVVNDRMWSHAQVLLIAQAHATLATAWPSTVCTCKPVLTMSGMEREVVDDCVIHGQAPEDDTRGVGMFPCPVCGRRFRTGAQVLDHSIAAHTEDS